MIAYHSLDSTAPDSAPASLALCNASDEWTWSDEQPRVCCRHHRPSESLVRVVSLRDEWSFAPQLQRAQRVSASSWRRALGAEDIPPLVCARILSRGARRRIHANIWHLWDVNPTSWLASPPRYLESIMTSRARMEKIFGPRKCCSYLARRPISEGESQPRSTIPLSTVALLMPEPPTNLLQPAAIGDRSPAAAFRSVALSSSWKRTVGRAT